MRLDQIEIKNFRCFEDAKFDFDENFTVFIGENGSGKSAVIDAVTIVFVQFGMAMEDLWSKAYMRANHQNQIRLLTSELPDSAPFVECWPMAIIGKVSAADYVEAPFNFGFSSSPDKGNAFHGSLNVFASRLREGESNLESPQTWPVLVCFRAGRVSHVQKSLDWNSVMTQKPLRRNGYNDWGNAEVAGSEFSAWLARNEAISFQEGKESPLVTGVKKAVVNCIPDAIDIRFITRVSEPVITWKNGEKMPFSKLSDGQRAMLAMVGDIARRAALLNPHLGEKAPAETPGIVMIDEIDLHLHPRWQRQIVDDLKRTFPKMQFIATTHSPFIIQSLEEGELRKLGESGELEQIPIEYSDNGLEEIVRFIQGVELPATSERYAEKKEAAKDFFSKLRAGLNEKDPDLVRAKERFQQARGSSGLGPEVEALIEVKGAKSEATE